jgi:hypothetical protein
LAYIGQVTVLIYLTSVLSFYLRAVGGNFDETDTAAAHGTDKTDVDFRNAVTYSDAAYDNGQGGLGWLFGDDDEYPWKMPASGGYPVLYWQE